MPIRTYEFSEKGQVLGRYEGADLAQAQALFIEDTDYSSWEELVDDSDESSRIEAREVSE